MFCAYFCLQYHNFKQRGDPSQTKSCKQQKNRKDKAMKRKPIGMFKNKTQMYSYLAMLKRVAIVDSKYSEAEQGFIIGVLNAFKAYYPNEDVQKLLDIKKWDKIGNIAKVFGENTRIAREVLRNCIVISHVDGEYSKNEKSLVVEYAKMLGIDVSVVKSIELLVKKQFKANVELQKIIDGGK